MLIPSISSLFSLLSHETSSTARQPPSGPSLCHSEDCVSIEPDMLLSMRQPSWLVNSRTYRSFSSCWTSQQRNAAEVISSGIKTPFPDHSPPQAPPTTPFYFGTGYALFAKRPSRPFPPPFLSPPSASFSDPLSTHNRSRDRRNYVNGEMIRGITNGDDAVLVNENFIGANDGVGAWASRPKGHAAYEAMK